MDRNISAVLLLILTTVNAGVLPAPKVLEGPSSKTTIVGPDGSKISAFAPGGKIVLDESPGPVLQGAPEVVAIAGVAQPLPVVQTELVEKVTAVTATDIVTDTPEATSVEDEEQSEISRSAVTENDALSESSSVAPAVNISNEANSESLELVESETDSTASEKVTESPFHVVPLVKEIVPIAVSVVEPQPVVAYIRQSPLYVPDPREFDGRFLDQDLVEDQIVGW